MKPYPAGQWCSSVLHRSFRPLALACLAFPIAAQGAPVALFTTDPNPAEGGTPLTVQFIDQSTGTISSWLWDFGDGGPGSVEQNPVHVFVLEQPFDVSLTVTGPGGSSTFTLEHAVDVLPTTNGVAGAPPALSTMEVPVPNNLGDFVKDQAAAVQLGKALFWDLQLGSDGMTACASCHFHAGADNRVRNTMHPGSDGTFDVLASGRGGGPNFALTSGDFPFRKFFDPNTGTELIADTNDRRGATGVLNREFVGTQPGMQFDSFEEKEDPTFQVDGIKTLRVTGRDAPTAIGSIFFHRIFWDGRANHFFNGKNIWGNTDPDASVLEMLPDGSLGEIAILLEDAAAASQAVGPPLSDVEMSWAGRTWLDVGRKMVERRPLASQNVDLDDSILGPIADPTGPGLRPAIRYSEMIRRAFHERWWGSSELRDGFTQMESNFSLFFGLAIQVYEATLVPGETPYDRWANGDLAALTEQQRRGLDLFVGVGGCINCHGTPMFAGGLRDEVITPDAEAEGALESMAMANPVIQGGLTFTPDANVQHIERRVAALYDREGRLLAWTRIPAGLRCAPAGRQVLELEPTDLVPADAAFLARVRATTDGNCGLTLEFGFSWNENGPAPGSFFLRVAGKRMEVSVQASNVAVYDNGFYNIGVTPTDEDRGVGNDGPFGPLAMTRRVQNDEDIGHPPGISPVAWFQRTAVNGSFKAPTLRNVELTGPYMHNGSMANLEQVVEFYARGGNFSAVNVQDLDPDISGFPLTEQDKADLVAFMRSLTDPRVRFERAPFDHPELVLKEGQVGDHEMLMSDSSGNAVPVLVYKPATGSTGGTPLETFEERLPASISVTVLEESAAGARVGFLCDKRPVNPVRVRVRLSNPALATLSTDAVIFDPADWRAGREVLVTPIGGSSVVLQTARAQSADPEFAGLPVLDVPLDFQANLRTNTNDPGQTAAAPAPGGAGSVGK